jgi:hypothetical protein
MGKISDEKYVTLHMYFALSMVDVNYYQRFCGSTMDLLVLDTAIPYKRMSTLKKHITDFGTLPHFILTCIKISFSLLLQYVCRFDVSHIIDFI